jgi:hypothetical protein
MRWLVVVIHAFLIGCATPPLGQPVTAYEGARVIVGDGRVIGSRPREMSGSRPTPRG